MPTLPVVYRGRFAPSPTGPLHFGSLISAVGSFLQARSQQGQWLLRLEDVDTTRNVPQAADEILRTLDAYGLHWDGAVLYQTSRQAAYQAALTRLRQAGHLFDCGCSRRDLQTAAPDPNHPELYPGTCRHGLPPGKTARSVRLRVTAAQIGFNDLIQGHFSQHLTQAVGDFVLQRADGPTAYQLAVVVDDAEQGITEIVRGSDLLDSTPRQLYLQRCLGLPTPSYAHLPVALNAQGQKLSKQTLAPALDKTKPVPALCAALAFLGQQPPNELLDSDLDSLWQWALTHWCLAAVPQCMGVKLG